MTIFKTREEAQRYANHDHHYYVRRFRGWGWAVWDEISDHVVEFDPPSQAVQS